MNMGWNASWLGSLAVAILLAGCGDAGENKTAAPGDSEAAPAGGGLKLRTVASLPKIGDYLPPQDGGRIEVAPPAGWKTLPRGAFVAGFFKEKQNELPRITVDAQPAMLEGISNATAENANELAAKLGATLKRQTKALQEPPLPIMLGDTVFIRHVRLAKHGGSPAVIQSLQTVKDGRLYTVDLFCDVEAARADEYEGSLKKWRDQGYAVAANLKFLAAEDASTGEAAAEAPAGEPSTETPPAEAPAAEKAAEPSAETTSP